MGKTSIILMIASFFIFLFAIADQIRRIKNLEIKNLLRKTTNSYFVTSGVFDVPPLAIIGIIISSFLTVFLIIKLIIQGKLRYFIKALIKERDFMKIFIFITLIWLFGTLLSYKENFIEYALLIFSIIVILTIKMVASKIKDAL